MTGIQCFPHISFNLKGRKLPCFQRDLGCGLFSQEQKWWSYCLLTYVSTTHSIVLSRPLPLVAEVLNTCQLWSLQFITQVNMLSQNVLWLVLCPVYLLTVLMPFLSSSSSNMATNADLEIHFSLGTTICCINGCIYVCLITSPVWLDHCQSGTEVGIWQLITELE